MVVCAIAAFCVLIYLTAPLDSAGGAEVNQASCHKVTPATYNRWVRRLDRLDRVDLRRDARPRAKHRVCKHTKFAKLKLRVRATESACRRNDRVVTASEYGGAGDDNGIGYRGADLSFDDKGALNTPANWNTFAELSVNYWAPISKLDFAAIGRAFGGSYGLPNGAAIYAHNDGVTVRSVKRDVGGGGKGLTWRGKVRVRAFDALRPLARKLRIYGLTVIRLTRQPCRGVFG